MYAVVSKQSSICLVLSSSPSSSSSSCSDRMRRQRTILRTTTTTSEGIRLKQPSIDEGYNCVVTENGAIVSSDIPSGTYEVSAWWGPKNGKGEKTKAPRCDTEKQRGCEIKCELVEEGCLVCEGLAEGTYRVTNVKDLNEECEVSVDGTSISCDEADAETFDVGDLELKEKADSHSVRLGG